MQIARLLAKLHPSACLLQNSFTNLSSLHTHANHDGVIAVGGATVLHSQPKARPGWRNNLLVAFLNRNKLACGWLRARYVLLVRGSEQDCATTQVLSLQPYLWLQSWLHPFNHGWWWWLWRWANGVLEVVIQCHLPRQYKKHCLFFKPCAAVYEPSQYSIIIRANH